VAIPLRAVAGERVTVGKKPSVIRRDETRGRDFWSGRNRRKARRRRTLHGAGWRLRRRRTNLRKGGGVRASLGRVWRCARRPFLWILCEAELVRVHGGRNEAELTRRAPRLAPEEKRLATENLVRLRLVRTLQRLTGRSVKFIRWLPGATLSPASPRVGQRRPAPVLCGFVRGFLDTVVPALRFLPGAALPLGTRG